MPLLAVEHQQQLLDAVQRALREDRRLWQSGGGPSQRDACRAQSWASTLRARDEIWDSYDDKWRVGALRTIAGIIEAIPMAFELAELVAPFNADSTPVRLLPQIAVAGEACRQWVTTAS